MRTISIMWSFVLTVLFMTSCGQEDLAAPAGYGKHDAIAAKKGGGGNGGGEQGVVTYAGHATGLNATITTIQNGTVTSNQSLFANTGFLPAAGGSLTANAAQAVIEGVLTAETLDATVTGAGSQTTSASSVSLLNVTVGGKVITADYLSSSATATCGSASGTSLVQNLVIDGTPVVVTGEPNQLVFFPTGGFVMINEKTTAKGKAKNVTVTALRIVLPNAADIRVAQSRAEVKC